MKFEEDFPSLREFMYEDMSIISVFNHKDLQEILVKHCLDKQRVREAIIAYITDADESMRLINELGLE